MNLLNSKSCWLDGSNETNIKKKKKGKKKKGRKVKKRKKEKSHKMLLVMDLATLKPFIY
jgi:hypothetical protein